MAIDDKYLDGIDPSNSAVQRLKRKRLRPWETNMVPRQESENKTSENKTSKPQRSDLQTSSLTTSQESQFEAMRSEIETTEKKTSQSKTYRTEPPAGTNEKNKTSEKETSVFDTSKISPNKPTTASMRFENETSDKQTSSNHTSLIQAMEGRKIAKETSRFRTSEKSENKVETSSIRTSHFQTTQNETSLGSLRDRESSAFPRLPTSPDKDQQRPHTEAAVPDGSNTRIQRSTGISYNGFFPLTCTLFEPSFFLELSPGELKLYLYMSFLSWRYPEDPAVPGVIRTALPYLVKGVAISRSTVFLHLQRLSELNLIRLVEEDKKHGNRYYVYPNLLWLRPENAGTSPHTVSQSSQKKTSANETSHFTSPLDGRLPVATVSEELGTFLSGMKPQGKRERETKFLRELLLEYQPDLVLQAVRHVTSNKMPSPGGTLTTVEHPFMYLSVNMEAVLKCLPKAPVPLEPAVLKEPLPPRHDLALAEQLFNERLTPHEQTVLIERFKKKAKDDGHPVPESILRRTVISCWYEDSILNNN